MSVIKNLAAYQQSDNIESHVIYTINEKQIKQFDIPVLNGVESQSLFYYSSLWNFYHTCQKLSQLLPDDKAVVVAHDWLELGMISHLGLNNPVVQVLHGDYDYYYSLSVKHSQGIDRFITVAQSMADHLRERLPARANNIKYLPFPVPAVTPKSLYNNDQPLQLIFVGRLVAEKGYDILPSVDSELRSKGVEVKWHIVGEVTAAEKSVWSENTRIEFLGQIPNESVIELMRQVDCLLLPSVAEGMPVTLIEAMKVGLTCLVNDLRGGIQELIADGVTGFKVKGNQAASYANLLAKIHGDRSILRTVGEKAKEKATNHFEPNSCAARYEQVFEHCANTRREERKPVKIYGSRLDENWIPNFITKTIRRF